jgi:hypothetical protein
MGSSNCSADRKLRAREVGGGRRSGLNGLNGLRSGLNGSARKSWKRRRRREEVGGGRRSGLNGSARKSL